MEGPYLPEGAGDEESPEELERLEDAERAIQQYEERMRAFEDSLELMNRRPKRRRSSDYRTKNCEEASGGRG